MILVNTPHFIFHVYAYCTAYIILNVLRNVVRCIFNEDLGEATLDLAVLGRNRVRTVRGGSEL